VAKHTIKGFITLDGAYGARTVRFSMYRPSPKYSPHEVVVSEHSIEIEIPDDFDPVPQMVASLEEKKRLARIELAKELAVIDDQIKQLTCIDYVPAPLPVDDIPF